MYFLFLDHTKCQYDLNLKKRERVASYQFQHQSNAFDYEFT